MVSVIIRSANRIISGMGLLGSIFGRQQPRVGEELETTVQIPVSSEDIRIEILALIQNKENSSTGFFCGPFLLDPIAKNMQVESSRVYLEFRRLWMSGLILGKEITSECRGLRLDGCMLSVAGTHALQNWRASASSPFVDTYSEPKNDTFAGFVIFPG